MGGGYAIHILPNDPTITSDYNNLYTSGTYLAIRSGSSPGRNLAEWQALSGQDSNSISVDPYYISDTDLHVRNPALDGRAIPLSSITDDIDGDDRDTTNPDIGADEFIPSPFNAGIDAIITELIDKDSTFQIVLSNKGTATLTQVEVHYEIDSVPQPVYNWTGSLAQGDTAILAFSSPMPFTAGVPYHFKAWTALPNDMPDGFIYDDTAEVANQFASLHGTYTIGGTTPDFSTFNEAAFALNNGGIIAAVTFNARSGTYNEQVSIYNVEGTSATNTITFQSESGDSTDVIITYTPEQFGNYVFELFNMQYTTIQNMTLIADTGGLGRVISIVEQSRFNHILNNVIIGIDTNSSISSDFATVYRNAEPSAEDLANSFTGNTIQKGTYGIYYVSYSTNKGAYNVFRKNRLEEQSIIGMSMYYQENVNITENEIFHSGSYHAYAGLHLESFSGNTRVNKNRLQMIEGGSGFLLRSFNHNNDTLLPALITNNFVHIGGIRNANGIQVLSCRKLNLYHNNILITSPDTIDVRGITVGLYSQSIDLRNNVVANLGGGYAMDIETDSSLSHSDYNDLYTTGDSLGRWNGNPISNLSTWQDSTGLDSNSVSLDPLYVSNSDLHVRAPGLNGAATPISSVTDDIDGEARDTVHPDIGADEFTPPPGDLGITALVTPGDSCFFADSTYITIGIRNFGTGPQNAFDVSYSLNGAPVVTENVGMLVLDDSTQVNYTFSTPVNLATSGSYSFSFYTSLPGDVNNSNDTLAATIQNTGFNPSLSTDTSICPGESIMLSAGGGSSYLWSTGANDSIITVSPSVTTTYSVTITHSLGCVFTDSVSVSVHTPAPVSIGDPDIFCPGELVQLTASSGTACSWIVNDGTTSMNYNGDTISFVAANVPSYSIQLNCTDSASSCAISAQSTISNAETAADTNSYLCGTFSLDTTFVARQQILTGDSCTGTTHIQAGANVIMRAGNRVLLRPGFRAFQNSYYKASIGPVCDTTESVQAKAAQENNHVTQQGVGTGAIRVYPNPFNQELNISYQLEKAGTVRVHLRDLLGKEVAQMNEGSYQEAGAYEHRMNLSQLQAGIYLLIIEQDEEVQSRRLVKINR